MERLRSENENRRHEMESLRSEMKSIQKEKDEECARLRSQMDHTIYYLQEVRCLHDKVQELERDKHKLKAQTELKDKKIEVLEMMVKALQTESEQLRFSKDEKRQ